MLLPVLLRRVRKILKRGIGAAALASIIVIIYSTFSEYFIERNLPGSGIHSLFTSLWWTMQTITTVGYGDTPVVGYLGRTNAIFIMVFGIGSLGFMLSSLAASLIDNNLKRRLEGVIVKEKNHVIICNYDSTGKQVVLDLMEKGYPIVMLSDTEIKDRELDFDYVRGSALNESDLKRAGIMKCNSVILLASKLTESREASEIDALTIVAGMKIKKINPRVNVIAEILTPESAINAKDAGIDEVVVRGALSSSVISKSVFTPGMSDLLLQILSGKNDIDIKEIDASQYRDKNFSDVQKIFHSEGKFIVGFRIASDIFAKIPNEGLKGCDSIIYMERSGTK